MLEIFLDWFVEGITYALSGGAYLRKAEKRRAAELGPMPGLIPGKDPVFTQIRYVRRMTRWMVGIGLLLVWIVGTGVKIIMDSLGKPTSAWSDFTGQSLGDLPSKLPMLGLVSLVAGAPLLFVAFIGKGYLGERVAAGVDTPVFGRHAKVVLCAYVGAVLPAIYVYGLVWWFAEADLGVILIPPAIALGAGIGYFAGYFIFDPEPNSREKGPDTPPWYPP